uniref:Uncharacterized protein n=1 Tax=Trichogramma kaykai TaxID=54128 RepID=A0ABD2WHI1_9HYME
MRKPIRYTGFSATAEREIVTPVLVVSATAAAAAAAERILSRTPSSSGSDVVRPRRNDAAYAGRTSHAGR